MLYGILAYVIGFAITMVCMFYIGRKQVRYDGLNRKEAQDEWGIHLAIGLSAIWPFTLILICVVAPIVIQYEKYKAKRHWIHRVCENLQAWWVDGITKPKKRKTPTFKEKAEGSAVEISADKFVVINSGDYVESVKSGDGTYSDIRAKLHEAAAKRTTNPEYETPLSKLLEESAAKVAAMPKAERDAMIKRQNESAAKSDASWPETSMVHMPIVPATNSCFTNSPSSSSSSDGGSCGSGGSD